MDSEQEEDWGILGRIPSAFLEKSPLYKPVQYKPTSNSINYQGLLPPINRECEHCKTTQTFRLADDHQRWFRIENAFDRTVFCTYVCLKCRVTRHHFALRFSDDGELVQKIGQYPPWSIEPPTSVKKALGEHLQTYKKGLINESQGYGIGAFAYYRRIVEALIGKLLEEVGDLIGDEAEHAQYVQKLQTVKASHSAEAKIDVVKDLIPAVLRPDGINPLGTLHDALSQGLHSESDEECLDLAGIIRESLVFLVEQVTASKKRAQDYSASIGTLKKRLDQKGRVKIDPK